MIRHSQPGFDADAIIEDFLVTPATVTTDGLLGRFDSLRAALEHLQTRDTANTILAVLTPGEELQFTDGALETLTVAFAQWLYDAGLLGTGISIGGLIRERGSSSQISPANADRRKFRGSSLRTRR